jgi:hypothetical protein
MSKKNIIVFLAIILIASFLYEYQDIIFLLPQSVHHWRQSDCASFAMIYYEEGMKFFEPKVYNVLMGGGNCAGECPILYYFVACLYKIFGPHEFIFRLVCLLIFYGGLVSLLNITYRFLADKFYSFYVPLLLFTSPLIVFFANNFLCDVPSLSMSLIAWSFILKYRDTGRLSSFWLSMLFFALAGLLKANGLISFVALGGMYFLELNQWIGLNRGSKLFIHLRSNIAGFILVFVVVAGWYLWAIHYNEQYGVSFLGTKAWPGWPIWEVSDKDFLSTTTKLFFHATHIFHLLTCALVVFLICFINANRAYTDKFLYGVFLLTLIGSVFFLMMFFVGLQDNIYYFVNIMIVPVFVFIAGLEIMRNRYTQIFNSIVFKGVLLVFLGLNVAYAKSKQKVYYHEGQMHFHSNKNFYDPAFKPFLDSIGVAKTDLVISMPDPTPDITLYLIGRMGWTEFNIQKDTAIINKCIGWGARYLIINDLTLAGDPALMNYTGDFVAKFNSILIYRLGGPKQRPKANQPAVIRAANLYLSFDSQEIKNVLASDTIKAKKFFLLRLGNDRVAVKTEEGKYLSANMNNNAQITASTVWIADWEQFSLVELPGGKCALKAVNGKFLSVQSTEPHQLIATAETIGPNESFQFIY